MTTKQTVLTAIFSLLIFFTSVIFWTDVPAFFLSPLEIIPALFALVFLTLLLSLLTVFSFLLTKTKLAGIVFALSTLPALVVFSRLALPLSLNLLICLGLWSGETIYFHRINQDKQVYIRPDLNRVAGRNFGWLFLLFSLGLSAAYYLYAQDGLKLQPVTVPEAAIDWSARTALNFLSATRPEAVNLPPAVIDDLVLKPLKNILRQQLQNLLDQYRPYLAVGLAASIFLTLTTLGSVVRILALPISDLILLILRSLKLVTLKKETREVESYQLTE